ncbi:MAG: hypothetical protein K1X78_07800 [Verrucomicrobiaceae bacterium]|nr:hypothetical protein [Verrucomicrobiaceae bacterium]
MKQYRPTIEQLKKRYSAEMARRKMIERRHAEHPELATRKKIPDNSEPWLPHLPRTADECWWVSEQVAKNISEWKQSFPSIFSSAG